MQSLPTGMYGELINTMSSTYNRYINKKALMHEIWTFQANKQSPEVTHQVLQFGSAPKNVFRLAWVDFG